MTASDRRFTSWLGMVAGPLFVLGGLAAAFTQPGAWFIAIGFGMLAAGAALRTRVAARIAIALGIVLVAALIAWIEERRIR